MSMGVTVDFSSLEAIDARISKLADLDMRDLLRGVGAELESQTRRRIETEKTDPDSIPWEPWSDHYARTRRSGQSLLLGAGDLLDSICFETESDSVIWGSNMIYARTHQEGRGPIPARPFLGIGDDNRDALEALVVSFLNEVLS
jgi:phage virion morphogenesis protein